ncbi:MAG: FecR domain-containing protein [Gammaproteobacteria bacterium]|nr:FecR domain-containing protein [Gammaproteobacteria bacterium]
MRSKFILIFFGLAINLYSCFVFAAVQSPIGSVVFVQGKVVAIDQANQKRSLQRRSTIYLHDKIVTQENSKTQLILKDNSVITVQAASEFYVSEFSFNKGSPRNNKYVGNIAKGMLINISGQGDTKNYQLNSPLTTIAFRGTGISTKLVTKGGVLNNQDISVFQGYVTVNNRCDNVIGPCKPERINIGAGQKFDSVSVNRAGKIQGFKGSESLLHQGAGALATKVLTEENGGRKGVTIRCK